MQGIVSTVDLVPLFRSLGEETYKEQLHRQYELFSSILKQMPSFAKITDEVYILSLFM